MPTVVSPKPKKPPVLKTPPIPIPKELTSIPHEQLTLILPDVSLLILETVNNLVVTSCNKVTFKITYSPGLFRSAAYRGIEWRVVDKVYGIENIVSEGTVYLPGTGGFAIVSVEFPMPSDAKFEPDFINEITVVVDPNKKILERTESNNQATVNGVCLG